MIENSIIYSNSCYYPTGGDEWHIVATTPCSFAFSCTRPDPGGVSIITNHPCFANTRQGDYHVRGDSPCIDTGTTLVDMVTDLQGIPRPLDGNDDGQARWDIGAYEFVHPSADTDGDQLGDLDEINAYGTDPTNTDTDQDALSDYNEVYYDGIGAYNPYDRTNNPSGTDSNASDPDTDDDGVPDGGEVSDGTDALDPNDYVAVWLILPEGLRVGALSVDWGWKWSDWFECFYADPAIAPWIYHVSHGWLCCFDDGSAGLWFWTMDVEMHVLWSRSDVYPFLWRLQDNAWLWYLSDTVAPGWFYNLSTREWEPH
ncbi:choice-of-anchor Q domain-containing protein [Verrucomicrobiota bacterium]